MELPLKLRRSATLVILLTLALSVSGCGLSAGGNSLLPSTPTVDDDEDDDFDGIVGGEEVDPRKSRMANAVLQTKYVDLVTDENGQKTPETSRCTATLIGERVAITAAHCVKNILKKKLHAMRIDGENPKAQSAGFPVMLAGQQIDHGASSVLKIAVPPGFRIKKKATSPDIALLLLEKPIQPPAHALRPRLDSKGRAKTGVHLTAMGFGLTEFNPLARNGTPKGLFQKSLRVLDPAKVNWRNEAKAKDTFFLGKRSGQPDGTVCLGDSGGPVFSLGKKSGALFLVGVISRGELNCLGASSATAISPYVGWIQRQAAKWRTSLF